MTIYSVEGLGCVGKSTLVQNLKSSGIFVIEEIFEAFPETKEIQPFTLNDREAWKTNEWFLEKEIIRMEKATQQELTVLDRCVYSQIAYNYAKDKVYGTKQTRNLFERLKNLERQGRKLFPNMIYLHSTVDYSMSMMSLRAKNKEKDNIENNNPAYRKEFFEKIKKSYDLIAHILGENVLIINVPEQRENCGKITENWLIKRNKLPEITSAKLEEAHER